MKNTPVVLIVISILLVGINYPGLVTAQCTNQVTNLSGTSIVNGINVTVIDSGLVDSLSYCQGNTTPYWIGQNSNISGNGSYTFTFSPPVTGVTLNFSAISSVNGAGEEVHLFVNGIHYPVPTLGIANPCEPMAVLTPAGNIGACLSCGGAGTSGINITTPVSTITVADVVFTGSPFGTVFSIFICEGVQTGIDNVYGNNDVILFPNPFNSNLNINAAESLNLELNIYDLASKKLIQQNITNSTSINTEQLARGIYLYEVKDKNGVIKKGKIMKE